MRLRSHLPLLLIGAAPVARAQTPAPWRLVEEWRVGGEVDGPYSFVDVRGLGLLPDGGVVLVDYKDEQVHFLDANGKAVRTVGRKGAGPGEFRAANGLAVSPAGTVIVNDPNNNRFTILSGNGDLLRTIPISQRWGFSYIWDAIYTPDSRLDEFMFVRKPGATEPVAARRVWSRDFTTIDTVLLRDCPVARAPEHGSYSFSNARGRTVMQVPFQSPQDSLAQAPDGSMWSGRYPGYVTIGHTARQSCDPDVSITLTGARVRIPDVVRDSQVQRVQDAAARYGAPAPDVSWIPREYPAYERLMLDDAGRLWVERRVSRGGGRQYEIYAANGRALGAANLPRAFAPYRPTAISQDRIIGFVADENDVLWLTSYRIVR